MRSKEKEASWALFSVSIELKISELAHFALLYKLFLAPEALHFTLGFSPSVSIF